MTEYKCKIIDKSGKMQIINKEATSEAEITKYLRQNLYTIITIESVNKDIDLNHVLDIGRRVTSKDLSVFCRQLHVMLDAGLTIVNCLEILKLQTENKKLNSIIPNILEEVQKGNTFSEVLSKYRDIFPDILISMVEVGEVSGNIDIVMDRLAIHFEKEYKIDNKIKSAMAYPVILSIVATAVVIFMLVSVMPQFIAVYQGSGVQLPAITVMMVGVSKFIATNWYIIIVMIIILIFIIPILIKNKEIAQVIDKIKLKIPVVKTVNLRMATSKFVRTLSTLMGSGVPFIQSLEIASKVTGNSYIERLIIDAKEEVKKGLPLSQILKKQNVFEPMVYSMMKIGEDSGSIEDILNKTADFYDEEVEMSVQQFTSLLEPLMIVVMAVVIGFIILAMVIPMFDMIKIVQ